MTIALIQAEKCEKQYRTLSDQKGHTQYLNTRLKYQLSY